MNELRRIDGDKWIQVKYEKDYDTRGHLYWNEQVTHKSKVCAYCGQMDPWLPELQGKHGIRNRRLLECTGNPRVEEAYDMGKHEAEKNK